MNSCERADLYFDRSTKDLHQINFKSKQGSGWIKNTTYEKDTLIITGPGDDEPDRDKQHWRSDNY